MDASTRAIGTMEPRKASADRSDQMATISKANGRLAFITVKGSITMPLEPNMTDHGSMESDLAMVKRTGWMVLGIKDNIIKAKRMEMVSSSGQIRVSLKAILQTTVSMEKVFSCGLMDVSMTESGWIT